MITDIGAYVRYFESVRRRTERDVQALPSAAAAWRPSRGGGETGWSLGQIVVHIGASRLYFASAYRGEGWIWGESDGDPHDQATWLPWLVRSAERYVELLRETPDAWLTRRIEMIDTPGQTLAGWRILMMMLEHEVHHRSQLDAYAGLEGWPVPQIFGRSAESIDALQDTQRARHGRTGPPEAGASGAASQA